MTDWSVSDGAVATCKGIILGTKPDIEIVDISHEINDIPEGAFVLATTYKWFPRGTIFLVVIDPGVGSERRAVVIKTKDYLFVGPDNGLFGCIDEKEIEKVIELQNKKFFLKPISRVFHGRDIFSPVAAFLASGGILEELGVLVQERSLVRIPVLGTIGTTRKENNLFGTIVFVDNFGNLVVNVAQNTFLEFVDSLKKFKIRVGNAHISHLSKTFSDGEVGEVLALFGGDFRTPKGNDLLTIAVNLGNAAETTEAKRGDRITITRTR